MPYGRLLPQGFVGPLLVVLPAELVKGPLLRSSVPPGWTGYLPFQGPVQPLQPSVLFRVPRFYPLRQDPQLHPPH